MADPASDPDAAPLFSKGGVARFADETELNALSPAGVAFVAVPHSEICSHIFSMLGEVR